MKKLINRARCAGWPLVLLLGWLPGVASLSAAPEAGPAGSSATDYEQPKVLVANILPMAGQSRKALFRSRRAAVRSGTTVNVTCEYTYPDGSVAARDRIVYEGSQLASVETEEFQTGEKGVAVIRADPKNPARRKIFYEYTIGQGSNARKSTDTEVLANDTLVDDMIPGFMVSHWDALSQGTGVKFRYIALSRKETVGFRLIKESETYWHRTPVLRVKMEPTSFIIAQLVDPMFFVVEKKAPHRILEYIGRTTPLLKEGNKWKDLDADTVFEWEQPGPLANSASEHLSVAR
jgi:hypothetical protein